MCERHLFWQGWDYSTTRLVPPKNISNHRFLNILYLPKSRIKNSVRITTFYLHRAGLRTMLCHNRVTLGLSNRRGKSFYHVTINQLVLVRYRGKRVHHLNSRITGGRNYNGTRGLRRTWYF